MSKLSDGSISLMLTSPPYFAYKDYGEHPENFENSRDYEEYIERMEDVITHTKRILCEDGRMILIVDDKHTNLKTEGMNVNRGTHARLINIAEHAGFEYKDIIIWAKIIPGHASGGSNYMLGSYPYPPNIPLVNMFEYILVFRKAGKSRVTKISEQDKEMSKLGFTEFKWASESIWYVPAERNREHPCPFPEDIPKRLIKLFSFHGETVYDPFFGSGTTGLVAEKLGRRWIGSEINEEFADYANKRIEGWRAQLALAYKK
jgi:site-specific DNA-methyltransferase (adenine-specific)